jgi:hypothetical protein
MNTKTSSASSVVRISTPQFRMLGRLIRGDVLSTHRYRKEHATIGALKKKRCVHVQGGAWLATDFGKLTHSRQGGRGQRYAES